MVNNLINRDNKFIAGIEKIRFFPVAPVGGDGCYIIEENGRRLLDFAGSWGAAGLGYSHPAITEAITRASKSMASSSLLSYASEPAITLAEELLAIVPGDTPRKVWFGHSGRRRRARCRSRSRAGAPGLARAARRRWARAPWDRRRGKSRGASGRTPRSRRRSA